MSMIDESGAAFPQGATYVRDGKASTLRFQGMTLRQWYAGQTLSQASLVDQEFQTVDEEDAEQIARAAFRVADAMIAQGKREITALSESDKVSCLLEALKEALPLIPRGSSTPKGVQVRMLCHDAIALAEKSGA